MKKTIPIKENEKVVKKLALRIGTFKRKLSQKDIGKLFWRVEYKGVLRQYCVKSVSKNGTGEFKIANLTSFKGGYGFVEEVDYWCSSKFGVNVIKNNKEFYTSYSKAKESLIARYHEEVNPNGSYRVVRYFDDFWEAWESEVLSKKEAIAMANKLNESPRCYVRYDIEDVTKT